MPPRGFTGDIDERDDVEVVVLLGVKCERTSAAELLGAVGDEPLQFREPRLECVPRPFQAGLEARVLGQHETAQACLEIHDELLRAQRGDRHVSRVRLAPLGFPESRDREQHDREGGADEHRDEHGRKERPSCERQ